MDTRDTRDESLRDLEAQLMQWGAQLDELTAAVEKADTEADAEYRQRVNDLEAQHDAAQSKLDQFKGSRPDKWARFRTGVGRAWCELAAAFQELRHQ
jgi:chromosome segregation ATPase